MAETEIKKINGRTVCDQTARDSIPKSASDIGADPAGTCASKVNAHNTSLVAHSDIRVKLQSLVDQLNSFLNVDDTTRDELSEVLALIDANKDLIEEITTKKVNVTDIINNLTTNISNQPLSAAQGVVLKELIDTLQTAVNNISVPTKTSQLQDDVGLAKQEDVDNLSKELADLKGSEVTGISADLTGALKTFFTNIQTLLPQLAYTTEDNMGNVLIANAKSVVSVLGGEELEEITATQTGTVLAISGVPSITMATQTGTVLALA